MPEVLTAPLAVIKVKGVAIGKMKSVRLNENYSRGEVRGIGAVNASEAPVLSFSSSLSADFYTVDLKKSNIDTAIMRNAQTIKEFFDNVILNDAGAQVDFYRKVPNGTTASGLVKEKLEIFASVSGVLLNGDGFDLSEGQISNRNQSFTVLDPVIFRD